MQELKKTWVQSLGQEDPLEEGMATHSSILVFLENPMDRGAWCAAVHNAAKSQTQLKWLSMHTQGNSTINSKPVNLIICMKWTNSFKDKLPGVTPEEKGVTEDEMVGWHHWLNGHEFEQAPGNSGGQRSLECSSPWDHRVRHDLLTGQK